MNDMTAVIVPKSDQINADDLIAGPRTIRIESVSISAGTEQPVSIFFEGSDKPWRPCKSMSRVLVAAWGPDAKAYVGRLVTLYRDPSVKWGGMEVGGIRVSHLSDIEREMVMALTATRGKRAPYVVKPLSRDAAPADDGLTAARAALIDAADLDALKRVWTSKAMAPFREQLQATLDQRKAELQFNSQAAATDADGSPGAAAPLSGDDVADVAEGPADDERGEIVTLDQALQDVGSCELVADVNARITSYEGDLSDEDMDELRSAAMKKIAELKEVR